MTILIATFLFFTGLIFGSFYNVVGLRIPEGASIVAPPSHCPVCEKRLTPRELIPVLSYVMQRGRCRNCGAPISVVYPLMELITGLFFLFSYFVFGWTPELLVSLAFVSLLVIIVVSDLAYMLIPDKVLLFFIPLFILLRVVVPMHPWWDPIAGALVGFGLLFLIALLSGGQMGGGDIKLFGVIGLVLGWQGVLVTFFLASLYGALFSVVGLLLRKLKRKQHIPFGPFIALGAICAYYYGDSLLAWYMSFL